MIDTITLALSEWQYKIYEPNTFMLATSRKGMRKWVCNPTGPEQRRGAYYPKLTLVERVNSIGRLEKSLIIQVSLPKMLFGDNFSELTDNDFEKVVTKLKEYLGRRSIEIFGKALWTAKVMGIHYGKNIVYTDGTTPKMIIDKVAQGDYTRRWDVEWVKYRDNGLLWKLHTNSWELALYDKRADMRKTKISEGRAEEKDNQWQMGLFDEQKRYKQFEVLRIEPRLNKRMKLKQTFKKIGVDCPLTFDHLFSEQIAKKVLLYYLDLIENARLPLFDYMANGGEDLLAELSINNPTLSPTTIMALAYIKQRIDHGDTLGGIREIVTRRADWRWRKLMKQAKEVQVSRREGPFGYIRSQIQNYTPLHLLDYSQQLINNDNR